MAGNVTLVDTSEVRASLTYLQRHTGVVVEELLRALCQEIRAFAKELVPVDTGNLRGTIGYRVRNGVATIFATAEHAAWVHEDLETAHRVGEAKYIERPVMEIGGGELAAVVAQELLRRLAAGEALRGGFGRWHVEMREAA
ncbi:MAG TPA: hypothetical protein PLZ36_17555 [Armatimonadota bacterium]|nr:hypothetical protein [Armatimonadota bacterium]